MTPLDSPLPPLRKSVTVPWPPERAFRRFTDEMGTWWPLRSHSVAPGRSVRCGFEGRVGGQIFEELPDGTRHVWGTVTAWEPPGRVAFSWHPGRAADTAQEVEVRFVAMGSGSRLELTHTGWERLGEDARKARRAYPLGWTYVLNWWAGREHTLFNRLLDGVMALMRVPTKTWFWIVAVGAVLNVPAAAVAYRAGETIHGGVHVGLALLFGWLALRLRRKMIPAERA